MPALAPRSAAPWGSSALQGQLLEALCDASRAGDERLETWCRVHAAHSLDAGTVALLPWMLERLLRIESAAGIAQLAQAAYLENSRLNLLRVGRLLSVLQRFAEAGLPALVLKGAALVLRYYRSFGTRAMADVDLLVRPDDALRAAGILADLDWTPVENSASAVLRTRVMRVQHACAFAADPAHSLDLHWRPLPGVTPETDAMFWDAAETVDVDATPVRVLCPTDQFFHVCCHAVQPSWAPSPRWMLDVHAILETHGTRMQWDRLLDTARQTRMTARLRAAIVELPGVIGARIPPFVRHGLAAVRASRWETRELALFERTPPFGTRDRLRWHWHTFRRLRQSDASWRRQPMLTGFLDYARLKRDIRRCNASR